MGEGDEHPGGEPAVEAARTGKADAVEAPTAADAPAAAAAEKPAIVATADPVQELVSTKPVTEWDWPEIVGGAFAEIVKVASEGDQASVFERLVSSDEVLQVIQDNWERLCVSRKECSPTDRRGWANAARQAMAQHRIITQDRPGEKESKYRLRKASEIPAEPAAEAASAPTKRRKTGSTTKGANRKTLLLEASAQGATLTEEDYLKLIPLEFRDNPIGYPVSLSFVDRSNFLTIVDEDGAERTSKTSVDKKRALEVHGKAGYRTVRANHGFYDGNWFFEASYELAKGPAAVAAMTGWVGSNPANNNAATSTKAIDGHIRLGWSTRRGPIEAPVGFTGNGIGLRDVTGELFQDASGEEYGVSWGPGDVIGCRINIHKLSDDKMAELRKIERLWSEWRWWDGCQGPTPAKPKFQFTDVDIEFYKNGVSMGVSSRTLRAAKYCPTISLYKAAIGKVNFGPDFANPCAGIASGEVQPICNLARSEAVKNENGGEIDKKDPVAAEPENKSTPDEKLAEPDAAPMDVDQGNDETNKEPSGETQTEPESQLSTEKQPN